MRVKILELGKGDDFYDDRDAIIGLIGELEITGRFAHHKGWYSGVFTVESSFNDSNYNYKCGDKIGFYAIKVEEVFKPCSIPVTW